MSAENVCELWPPTEIIALGYFDAPTEGVLKLSDGSVFRFETVAREVRHETCVLALAPLGLTDFEELVGILTNTFGTPRWPTWVPVWSFASEDTRFRTEQRVDEILGKGVRTTALLCSDN